MSNKCANPKCENEVKSTPGKRPRKYCSTRCTSAHWQALHYEPKRIAKNLIELPADFINCEKIGIIRADGTIEELKDFDQLPEPFKLAAKGIWELNTDVTHFKPQEPAKTKKEGKATQKEEAAVNGAKNASQKPAERAFPDIDGCTCIVGRPFNNLTCAIHGVEEMKKQNPEPIREKGEDALDFAIRKNAWKQNKKINHLPFSRRDGKLKK